MRIEKNAMVSAIDKVKGVIPKKATVPALEGALVKDGYLIANNTEIAVQVKLGAAGANDRYVIPTKALDMIRKMPDDRIEIRDEGKNMLSISCRAARNRMQTVGPDEFSYDAIKDASDKVVTVSGAQLMSAIKRVGMAASTSAAQMLMRGIYFEGERDRFNLVALDGHRIALAELPATGADGIRFVVPKTSTDRLFPLISADGGDKVKISIDEYSAVFAAEDYAASARLIDGTYFDYKSMMNLKGENAIELPRKELVDALGRATMVAGGTIPIVFEIHGDGVTILVTAPTGDYKEDLALDTEAAAEIRIGFDSKLFLDSLSNFVDDRVTITYNGPRNPVYITEEATSYKVLVLPVRIS